MIALSNRRQAQQLVREGKIPLLAFRRKLRHENVIILEPTDDVVWGLPQFGRFGLTTYIDDHERQQFSSVRYAIEDGVRIFAAVTTDRYQKQHYTIIAPDAPWLDHRLRLIFDVEGEEEEE